jgi:hypothetical protein
VDAVIRECERQLPPQEHTNPQFYADDGLIATHDPIYTQSILELFTQHFKRFGLYINHTKTETMTVLGSKPVHNISQQAYSPMIARTDPTNKDIQKQIIECTHCQTNVQHLSMRQHQQSQFCLEVQKRMDNNQPVVCLPINVEEETQEPQTHIISITCQQQPTCPHPNYPYTTHKGDRMRKHFRNRHPEDIVIIAQEGLLPQCPNCAIFQANAHTPQHQEFQECKKTTINKKKRLQETLQKAATNVQFFLGQEKIQKNCQFKIFRKDYYRNR